MPWSLLVRSYEKKHCGVLLTLSACMCEKSTRSTFNGNTKFRLHVATLNATVARIDKGGPALQVSLIRFSKQSDHNLMALSFAAQLAFLEPLVFTRMSNSSVKSRT